MGAAAGEKLDAGRDDGAFLGHADGRKRAVHERASPFPDPVGGIPDEVVGGEAVEDARLARGADPVRVAAPGVR